jgi:endonuclease III
MVDVQNTAELSELAGLVRSSVAGLVAPGRYTGLRVEIDLENRQGRWELLVLGVLLAARVSEEVAEAAFDALRQEGLLVWPEVMGGSADDQARLSEVLVREYRAVIDRERKAAAIKANAALLAEQWQGDLHAIYTALVEEPVAQGTSDVAAASQQLLRALRQFRQIDTRARWICRVCREAGIWPLLAEEVTVYYDRHVRLALQRLGLLKETGLWPAIRRDMEAQVSALFGFDTASLYKLGRFLCLPSDLRLCRSKCLAYPYCAYRKGHRMPQAEC